MLAFPGDTEADYQATLEFTGEIEQLYGRAAAKTGGESGFLLGGGPTHVFAGSRLEEKPGTTLSQVPLSPEWALGSMSVLAPSPGVDEEIASRYLKLIQGRDRRTALAVARNIPYKGLSMDRFVADYPEAVDQDGVVALRDCLFNAVTSWIERAVRGECAHAE